MNTKKSVLIFFGITLFIANMISTAETVAQTTYKNNDLGLSLLHEKDLFWNPNPSVSTDLQEISLDKTLTGIDLEQETLSGSVTDSQTGEALPGVSILVAGTNVGTTTDSDGIFELEVSSLQETLIFTFVGYERREVDIDGRPELNIELTSEIIVGDELVVVGYGARERRDITGSVASIDRRAIQDQPVYSIDNVLQGLASGVHVMQTGFRPGEQAQIRIRGNRSFEAGNEPLFVIDGVPIEGGLTDLNPREIESIEVLKDASATAIYGSRGANGVILVTTRQGFDGRSIEYSGFTGFQFARNRLDLMNTEQYAELRRWAHRLQGTDTGRDEDMFAPWEVENIREGVDTDWQDLVFGTGVQQNHTLSVRGGGNGTRYSISGTFDDNVTTVKNNEFTRLSGRLNLDQQITSRINAGINANYSNTEINQAVNFRRVVGAYPHTTPFDEDGNIQMYLESGHRNPYFDMQRDNFTDDRISNRLIGTIYADLEIRDYLRLRSSVSPDIRFRENGFYRRDEPASVAEVRNRRDLSMLYETVLDYHNTFMDVHRLDVTAMFGYQTFEARDARLRVSDLPYERQKYHNLGSAEDVLLRSSSLSEWKLESYMLRTNYIYDDRYLLTFTGRLDGSSRFAPGNEYGIFPSMAIAWQIGNESFMRNADFLSELKLRFSVGDIGNTGIRPYQTQGTVRTNFAVLGGRDIRAFEHDDLENLDLTWERTRTMDLGLDFAFLDDRISGTIDVYQSDTRDLLMDRQLPPTSGYSSTLENVGKTRNRGIEFSLSSVNIHTANFLWSSDVNFASNRNEIVELYGAREDDVGNAWFIGQPINVSYYWEWTGVWQENEAEQAAQYGARPGDLKIRDVNGDGRITDADRVILGTADPAFTLGVTNRFQYRGLDFSFLVYAVQDMFDWTWFGSAHWEGLIGMRADPIYTNALNVNYWTPESPSNEFMSPRFTSPGRLDLQAYRDLSFVRVRNITLGYSMPVEWTERLGIRNARIYTSVQNPFTFTSFEGYDPEGATGDDMPNFTTFLIGIDLSF